MIVPAQPSLAFLVSSTAPPRDPPQVLKLAKKAAKRKQIKRGVKEVIKAIRKAHKGVVIIAGDISPIDVITPLPVLCEDADIPYIYVPSKEELGAAGCVGRTGWGCMGAGIGYGVAGHLGMGPANTEPGLAPRELSRRV